MALSLIAQTKEPTRLVVGDPLPKIEFKDQNEESSPLPNELQKILFISDMEASKILHPLLEKDGDSTLTSKKAALISDIHRMPSFITRFLALPKMRSYSYTIRLIREEGVSDPFPREKGKITLIGVLDGKVKTISFGDNESAVKDFLESMPPPAKKQK